MTSRRPSFRRRIPLDRWIKLLIGMNAVLVALVAAGLLLDMWNSSAGHPAQAAIATPSPSSALMEMGLAHIPTSNACALCHDENGYVGLKNVPAVLHPIEGWRRCTVCHSNPELGRKAPGHEGIAEEECLNCHRSGTDGPPITQPHQELQDQACLACHGGVAHLPESMASTEEGDCVLCHKPTVLPPPEYPHPADAPISCRTCHQSTQVGGLPISHAVRNDGTCLLCHEIIWTGAAPSIVPPLPSASPQPVSRWPLLVHTASSAR